MNAQRGSRIRFVGLGVLIASLAGCGSGGNDDNSSFNVPNSLVIGDLNGDGVPDLAVATTSVANNGATPNPGFASIFLQNASSRGTFQNGTHYSTDNNPASIASGDLSGTGTTDLVVANFVAGNVSVLLETAPNSGQFQNAMNVATGGNPNEVVIADVNGDGKQDIVVADNASAGRVVILMQDPTNPAHFLAPVQLTAPNAAAGIAVGDINGDGKVDIVAATSDSNGNNGALAIYYQDPSNAGAFNVPVVVASGAQPGSVKIADLNADGLPDFAVANIGPGTDGAGSSGVSAVLQDPSNPGSFLAPVTYAAQGGAVHVVVADLNGDGAPDLVTANLDPAPTGSISVLLQDSTRPGVFQAATNYAGFGQPLAVAVGDLNGDGIPDIAVADGDTATVMLQTSTPGVFSNGTQIAN